MNFIRIEKVEAFFDTETIEFVMLNNDKEVRISKDDFDREYRSVIDNMSFSEALHLLKIGYNIARKKWHEDSYLVIMHSPNPIEIYGGIIAHDSYIAQRTDTNTLTPYNPTSKDLMSDDWVILQE